MMVEKVRILKVQYVFFTDFVASLLNMYPVTRFYISLYTKLGLFMMSLSTKFINILKFSINKCR